MYILVTTKKTTLIVFCCEVRGYIYILYLSEERVNIIFHSESFRPSRDTRCGVLFSYEYTVREELRLTILNQESVYSAYVIMCGVKPLDVLLILGTSDFL